MRHDLQQPGQPVLRQPAAEEERGLDGADRRVHGQPQLAIGQVAAQRCQHVHPVIQVVPLAAAQPAPVLLRQRVHLPVIDGQHIVVLDGYRDVVPDQGRQGCAGVVVSRQDLRGPRGDPVHDLVEHGHQDRRLAAEVPVDARADDARLGADVRHRDRVEAAAGAERGRGR